MCTHTKAYIRLRGPGRSLNADSEGVGWGWGGSCEPFTYSQTRGLWWGVGDATSLEERHLLIKMLLISFYSLNIYVHFSFNTLQLCVRHNLFHTTLYLNIY